jgi:hypothetical protein
VVLFGRGSENVNDSDYLLNVAGEIKKRFPLDNGSYTPEQREQIKIIVDGLYEFARLLIIEDYLFTLKVCEKALPNHTHPVHVERLREIETIFKTKFKNIMF